jgi:hypothetical protein
LESKFSACTLLLTVALAYPPPSTIAAATMITPNIVFMRALLFAGVYLDARADYSGREAEVTAYVFVNCRFL